ncbi:MAG TPA: metal-dependent hydrolase, partial [Candidatus Saccharimonadia bacterium]|nr:metal-dependent hydrolase [Candidatus Saccharimonadia bacterium]
ALFEFGGPVFGFVHHRGMTHSLLGGAGLALLGAGLLWSMWRSHPYWRVTWLVYLGVLLHIGMDYLTSYRTHIFLPFSAGHYTADAVFIVDFTYSALMITGLLLVRMVHRQRQERYGRASLVWVGLGGIAWLAAPALAERPLTLLALQSAGLHVMAFALVVGLVAWVCRHWQEHRAVVLGQVGAGAVLGYVALCVVTHAVAQHQMARTLGPQMAHVQRLAALPLPGGGPLQWRAIAVTDTTYLVSRVAIFPGTVTAPQSIAKGPGADDSVIQAASRYRLVRVFWDFARFPVIDSYVQEAETVVRYTDLRFSGDGRNRSWFDLTVHFDPTGQVQVIEFLNRLFHPTHPEF